MTSGYVYVLSNPSMPGVVKIGRSKHGGRVRAKALYSQSSGVPEPFKMEFELWSSNCIEDEVLVHEELQACRVNDSREFFKVETYEAIRTVVSVFVSSMDCLISHVDSTVDDDRIKHYSDQLHKIGFDAVPPEIADALQAIDSNTLINLVRIARAAKGHGSSKEEK